MIIYIDGLRQFDRRTLDKVQRQSSVLGMRVSLSLKLNIYIGIPFPF